MSAKSQQPARRDPERRYHDVTAPINNLVNADWSKRHYVYVHKACEFQGPDYYEALGYEYEKRRKGGPQPKVGFGKLPEGSEIEIRGHILMSISKEALDEIQQKGADGNTGWDLHERLQRRMLTEKPLKDPVPGPAGPRLSVTNDSSVESV